MQGEGAFCAPLGETRHRSGNKEQGGFFKLVSCQNFLPPEPTLPASTSSLPALTLLALRANCCLRGSLGQGRLRLPLTVSPGAQECTKTWEDVVYISELSKYLLAKDSVILETVLAGVEGVFYSAASQCAQRIQVMTSPLLPNPGIHILVDQSQAWAAGCFPVARLTLERNERPG